MMKIEVPQGCCKPLNLLCNQETCVTASFHWGGRGDHAFPTIFYPASAILIFLIFSFREWILPYIALNYDS